jgi:hypothetical protein
MSDLGMAAEPGQPQAATVVTSAVSLPLATLVRGAEQLAAGAKRRIEDSPVARGRHLRQLAREPLPVLWDVHPSARNASQRELGLESVAVEQIRGTAVDGAQRAGDFKPPPALRGSNWRGRWNRIRTAVNQLVALPPVDLLKTGDEYWVVDGHNRVAAALAAGQVAVDASVVELLLPGGPRPEPVSGRIGSYIAEGMRDVRAAGEGRLSRTASPAIDLDTTEAMRRDAALAAFGDPDPASTTQQRESGATTGEDGDPA